MVRTMVGATRQILLPHLGKHILPLAVAFKSAHTAAFAVIDDYIVLDCRQMTTSDLIRLTGLLCHVTWRLR